jgi:hypothetical protein
MTEKTKQKEVAEVPQSVTLSENLTEISSKIPHEKKQKQESVRKSQSPQISVCDVMKKNTSQIIKKMESQLPSNLQLYSDLYAEYLHMFDDLFGTCYISEKQFFDKLGIDQNTIKTFDKNSSVLTNFCSSQIDLASNYLRTYVQMRISAIKSYDKYVHTMMDSYAKMLSQYNSVFKR